MSNSSNPAEPAEDRKHRELVAVAIPFAITSATGALAWLTLVGLRQSSEPMLLVLFGATATCFITSLWWLLWALEQCEHIGVVSKIRGMALVTFSVTYVVLLWFNVCTFFNRGMFTLALVPFVLGLGIRYLGTAARSRARGRVGIIVDGPYKLVRHPRYLGTLISLSAVCVTIKSLAIGWFALVPFAVHIAAARCEERALQRSDETREAYRAYAVHVNAWIPSAHAVRTCLRDMYEDHSSSRGYLVPFRELTSADQRSVVAGIGSLVGLVVLFAVFHP